MESQRIDNINVDGEGGGAKGWGGITSSCKDGSYCHLVILNVQYGYFFILFRFVPFRRHYCSEKLGISKNDHFILCNNEKIIVPSAMHLNYRTPHKLLDQN